jgi:hypothetical protein
MIARGWDRWIKIFLNFTEIEIKSVGLKIK